MTGWSTDELREIAKADGLTYGTRSPWAMLSMRGCNGKPPMVPGRGPARQRVPQPDDRGAHVPRR